MKVSVSCPDFGCKGEKLRSGHETEGLSSLVLE